MTTYYVSKTGNNGNGLSLVNAKTTVAAGLALLAGSDTLMINDGVYAEGIISLIPGGAAGNHTIIQAINTGLAIIRPPSGQYIDIDEDYITLTGLWLDAINSGSGLMLIQDTTSHITIGYCKLSNTAGAHASSHGILGGLDDLWIHHCEFFNISNVEDDFHSDHGIYLHASNSIIEYNTFRDIPHGSAIQIYHWQTGNSPNNTIIRNNRIFNIGNTPGAIAYGVRTIFVWLQSDDTQIYNNLFYNCSYGIDISNSDRTLIYHNTFYNINTGAFVIVIDSACDATLIKNNIFFGNVSNTVIDSGTNTVQTTNQITDPSFVTPGSDFHLQSGSTAIGAGTNLAGAVPTDFDGITRPNPPSIGAYEAPSGSIPTGPLLENFDGYTTGVSIDGLNTGTGWTQSWDLIVGVATVEVAPANMSGKTLRLTSTSQVNLLRYMAAHLGSFNISFKMRLSITNPDSDGIGIELLDQSDNTQVAIFFNSAGNIITQAGTLLVTGFVANTVYKIIANFDTASHPGQVRFSIDDGVTFTAWESTVGAFTSINAIAVGSFSTNAHQFDLDDINDDVIVVIPPNNAILLGDCLT